MHLSSVFCINPFFTTRYFPRTWFGLISTFSTIATIMLNEEHSKYLINLRDSGVTNMWGATPFIQEEFRVTHAEAKQILVEWIESFE